MFKKLLILFFNQTLHLLDSILIHFLLITNFLPILLIYRITFIYSFHNFLPMFFDLIPAIHAASTEPIIDPSVAYAPGDIVTIGVSLIVLIAGLFAVLFIIWG